MIKTSLKNNKFVQSIKRIKDLFLEKLDALNLKVDQQIGQISSLLEEEIKTQHNTNVLIEKIRDESNRLLENSVFLLKSSIDTVKGIKFLIEASQQQQTISEKMLAEIRETHQSTIQKLIEVQDDPSNQLMAERMLADIKDYNQSTTIQKLVEVQEDSRNQDIFVRETLDKIHTVLYNQKFKVVADLPQFKDIETELMSYLYSFLPYHRAIDIGANRGDVSARLIQTGYEVYAFEPFPPVLEKLNTRLGDSPNFQSFPYALGSTNEIKDLHIAVDQTEDHIYEDSTFYSSLTRHALSEGLNFTESIPVTVKTLANLHESSEIPSDIGLVKIDTEGFDLEVIKGMGSFIYPVVVAEFWDAKFPFGRSGAMNHLKDLVPSMRNRNYRWNIIIYRIWGSYDTSFYCNSNSSIDNSWGNVFFFQDYQVFSEALKWCSAVMPATYFSSNI